MATRKWPRWPLAADRRAELAQYVNQNAAKRAVGASFWAGDCESEIKELVRTGALGQAAKAIYDRFSSEFQDLIYDEDILDLAPGHGVSQKIRSPFEILGETKTGNCLDLSLLFAGLCLECGLRPFIVLIAMPGWSHAMTAVDIQRGVREYSEGERCEGWPGNQSSSVLSGDDAKGFLKSAIDGPSKWLDILEVTGVARAKDLHGGARLDFKNSKAAAKKNHLAALQIEVIDVVQGLGVPDREPYEPSLASRQVAVLTDRFKSLFDRHELFGGRERELQLLDAFVNDEAGGYLFLTARSGFGKTALLAHWVNRLVNRGADVAFHFISQLDDVTDQDTALRTLCCQLQLFQGYDDELPAAESELQALYRQLLTNTGLEDHRIIVVLDGLDEANNWKPGPYLFPYPLPTGMFVVASGRKTALRSGSDWLVDLGLDAETTRVLELDTLGPVQISDLMEKAGGVAAAMATDKSFVRSVAEKSKGDPFYLRFLVEDIRDKKIGSIQALDEQPSGLNEYLEEWWNQVSENVGPERVQDFLGYLVVALGRLTIGDLTEISTEDKLNRIVFKETIQKVHRFISGNTQHGYSLCHPRFRDFLLSEFGEKALQPYKEKLVKYCMRWGDNESQYAVTKLIRHLLELSVGKSGDVKYFEQAVSALTDFRYLAARMQRETTNDVIADLRTSQEVAGQLKRFEDANLLNLVQSALELASRILAEDPNQLASQIDARLLPYEYGPIKELRQQALENRSTPLLRPVTASLRPAGHPLTMVLSERVERGEGPDFMFGLSAVSIMTEKGLAAAGDEDGNLWIWDVSSGYLRHRVPCSIDGISCCARLPLSSKLFLGSWGGTLISIDLLDEEPTPMAKDGPGAIHDIAVSESGDLICTAHSLEYGKRGIVRIWRSHDMTCQLEIAIDEGEANAVAFRNGGESFIISVGNSVLEVDPKGGIATQNLVKSTLLELKAQGIIQDEQIKGVSAALAKRLGSIQLPFSGLKQVLSLVEDTHASALRVSKDGSILAIGTRDGSIVLVALSDPTQSVKLPGHRMHTYSTSVSGMQFLNDDRTLVSSGWDSKLKLWDVEAKAEIGSYADSSKIFSLDVDSTGRFAITGLKIGGARIWNLSRAVTLPSADTHSNGARFVSATEVMALSGGATPDGDEVKIWSQENPSASLVTFPVQGNLLALNLNDASNEITFIDDQGLSRAQLVLKGKSLVDVDFQQTAPLEPQPTWYNSGVKITRNGNAVVCMTDSYVTAEPLIIWRRPNWEGQIAKRIVAKRSPLALSDDESTCVIASGYELLVVDLESLSLKKTIDISERVDSDVSTIALSPSCELAAFCTESGRMFLVQIMSSDIRELPARRPILKMRFSLCGEKLGTCSENMIELWDVQASEPMARLCANLEFTDIWVSTHGKRIVATDAVGSVHFLDYIPL